jgi:hypothetical protein
MFEHKKLDPDRIARRNYEEPKPEKPKPDLTTEGVFAFPEVPTVDGSVFKHKGTLESAQIARARAIETARNAGMVIDLVLGGGYDPNLVNVEGLGVLEKDKEPSPEQPAEEVDQFALQ